MKFASFGLGDTSYPKFNWAHRKLYNRLIQLGAQPICDRGESDEQQPEGWVISRILSNLSSYFLYAFSFLHLVYTFSLSLISKSMAILYANLT
jgi:sulfite reductase alpha subunit-like flavoprotein